MRNFDYYIKEVLELFGKKTVLAILSTVFLLVLSMALTMGFLIGKEYSIRFAKEANIAVFYENDLKLGQLMQSIQSLRGVVSVENVSRNEAFEEMKDYLGEELTIIDRLGENPFDAYLRVCVSTDIEDAELDKIAQMPFVSHVRDNREVIRKIHDITNHLATVGSFVVLLSFCTSALISYYVSAENIHAKTDFINILKALKAPYSFIIRPFLWHSILVNLISGIIAVSLFFTAMSFVRIETNIAYPLVGVFFCGLSVLVGVIATLVSGRAVNKHDRR